MQYEVTTGLTAREALDHAITSFGPGGAGLQLLAQTPLSLVFQGGGGHVVSAVQPGACTALELRRGSGMLWCNLSWRRSAVLLCVVIGLVGSLGIAPVFAASDRELLERLAVQTHHNKRLEGTQVHVVVQDGQVVLSGTVYLYSQKMLYEQIVWRTPGVVEVDNEIRVAPRLPVEDAEIVRYIRTLIQGQQHFQTAEITVDVMQGAVSLSGTFHDPGDILSLKHQVAEIEGVIRLEILARFVT